MHRSSSARVHPRRCPEGAGADLRWLVQARNGRDEIQQLLMDAGRGARGIVCGSRGARPFLTSRSAERRGSDCSRFRRKSSSMRCDEPASTTPDRAPASVPSSRPPSRSATSAVPVRAGRGVPGSGRIRRCPLRFGSGCRDSRSARAIVSRARDKPSTPNA